MIKGILSSGYGFQPSTGSQIDLNTLDQAEKINISKRLEMDNKLRDFNNFSGASYSSYASSVLSPAQMKIKIQEELRRKHETDEKKKAEAKELLKVNKLAHE